MLGGLGAGGGQQSDHLRHRVENRAIGLHSSEPVLYCALCLQPANLAQGRDLLTIAFPVTPSQCHTMGVHRREVFPIAAASGVGEHAAEFKFANVGRR
jgi:hypothetical protein